MLSAVQQGNQVTPHSHHAAIFQGCQRLHDIIRLHMELFANMTKRQLFSQQFRSSDEIHSPAFSADIVASGMVLCHIHRGTAAQTFSLVRLSLVEQKAHSVDVLLQTTHQQSGGSGY